MTRRVVCLTLLLAGAASASAQWPAGPIKLTLRPAPAPTPALKYVLLPELADMRPGNAALHYQRAHSFEWWSNIRRLPYYHEIGEWLDLPLDKEIGGKAGPSAKLPPDRTVRARVEFVRGFGALKEVDLGARRQSCEWEMTERLRKEGIFTLLPDVQGFREYAMLLAMRCRLELADRDFDRATYTLQTGFALGRHVADAPTLIHALVGNAICTRMLGRVEEFLGVPGSPNLYWALTHLPRPLIDLRKPLQGEMLMLEAEFPDLKERDAGPLSPQAQQRLLKKLSNRDYMGYLRLGPEPGLRPSWERGLGFLPTALKAYPAAKRALIAQGRTAEEVAALPVLQVVLIDAVRQYRRYRDDMLKWVNVPYPQARPHWEKLEQDMRAAAQDRPTAGLFLAFAPAIQKVCASTARLDRRVAALRCVEAVRLHAAAHGGRLPAKLSAITEVPIPVDPVTGQDFVYQVKGDRVTLRDPPLADGQPALPDLLHYELTFKR